jgi:diacylglycerol kinase (ATP)
MQIKLTPHPTLAEERVLAILSPSNVTRLPLIKAGITTVFPRLDAVAPRDLDHLREIVQRSAGAHRIVLAVGGDGTLNRVLNAADLTQQILGIVPAGTGNDFACTIGMPRQLSAAIAHLRQLTPQATDYGVVNGARYHTSAGFGLDSATLRLREVRKNVLTRNYNIAFLMALAGLRCASLHIKYDTGEIAGRFFWVLAMNTPQIGGGTRIAPKADITDGLLDMVLVRETSKLNLLRHMPATLRGKHMGLAMIAYEQVQDVSCVADAPVDYLEVDGELYFCGEREVSFSIRAGAMQFLR